MSAADYVTPPTVGAPYVVAVTAATQTAVLDLVALLGIGCMGKYLTIQCDDGAGVSKPFYYVFGPNSASFDTTLSPTAVSGNGKVLGAPLGYKDEIATMGFLRIYPMSTGYLRISPSSPL